MMMTIINSIIYNYRYFNKSKSKQTNKYIFNYIAKEPGAIFVQKSDTKFKTIFLTLKFHLSFMNSKLSK